MNQAEEEGIKRQIKHPENIEHTRRNKKLKIRFIKKEPTIRKPITKPIKRTKTKKLPDGLNHRQSPTAK